MRHPPTDSRNTKRSPEICWERTVATKRPRYHRSRREYIVNTPPRETIGPSDPRVISRSTYVCVQDRANLDVQSAEMGNPRPFLEVYSTGETKCSRGTI